MQTDKIQSWFPGNNSTLVYGFLFAQHRQVDPREARMETCAPHDVRYIEDATIL
jgi:hypothetical protein